MLLPHENFRLILQQFHNICFSQNMKWKVQWFKVRSKTDLDIKWYESPWNQSDQLIDSFTAVSHLLLYTVVQNKFNQLKLNDY